MISADRAVEKVQLHQHARNHRVRGVRQVHADEQGKRKEVFLDRRAPERSRQRIDQPDAGRNRQQRADRADQDGPLAEQFEIGKVHLQAGVKEEEQHPELRCRIAHGIHVAGRCKQPVVGGRGHHAEYGGAEQNPAKHLAHDGRLLEATHHLAAQHGKSEHHGKLQGQFDEIERIHGDDQLSELSASLPYDGSVGMAGFPGCVSPLAQDAPTLISQTIEARANLRLAEAEDNDGDEGCGATLHGTPPRRFYPRVTGGCPA
jgi:hypothetical protein